MSDQPPINYINNEAVISRILNREYIPQDVTDKHWVMLSDRLVLSNLDEVGIKWLMNQYDILELDEVSSLGHDFNDEKAKELDQKKIDFFAMLMGAKGGFTANNLVKQINVQEVRDLTQAPHQQGGFWNNVKGLIRGGGH